MTAKEFLLQYWQAELVVSRLAAEYDEQLEMVDNIRSPLSGDGTPHSSDVSNPTEQKAAELEEKTGEYKQAQLDALEMRQTVLDVVQRVPGILGEILYQRYINLDGKRLRTLDDIADGINYTRRRVEQLHGEALEYVKKLLF